MPLRTIRVGHDCAQLYRALTTSLSKYEIELSCAHIFIVEKVLLKVNPARPRYHHPCLPLAADLLELDHLMLTLNTCVEEQRALYRSLLFGN